MLTGDDMFGKFLLTQGVITDNQLDDALFKQKDMGLMLGETLVMLGYIGQDDLETYLEKHLLHHAEDLVNNSE
jgi:hypothetical protein